MATAVSVPSPVPSNYFFPPGAMQPGASGQMFASSPVSAQYQNMYNPLSSAATPTMQPSPSYVAINQPTTTMPSPRTVIPGTFSPGNFSPPTAGVTYPASPYMTQSHGGAYGGGYAGGVSRGAGTTPYIGMQNSGADEMASYCPANADYVPPGTALTGGMLPTYDMWAVPTFEAPLVITSGAHAPQYGVREREVSSAGTYSKYSKITALKPTIKKHDKKGCCC